MTELLEHPEVALPEPKTIEKVSVVISKGSLEGIYPGLIMANGARMEGIDADIFFTFFGLDAIRKNRPRSSPSRGRSRRSRSSSRRARSRGSTPG